MQLRLEEPLKILVVDDSRGDRLLYQHYLADTERREYVFVEAECGAEGLHRAKERLFDCILLDYSLPDMDGLNFLETLSNGYFVVPTILLTGSSDETVATKALYAGASDFLPKLMVNHSSLERAILNAIDRHRLQSQLEVHRISLEQKNRDLERKQEEISEFYHNVSHELKTPLTSAREFVSIVLDGLGGPLTCEQREYLSFALESCSQMGACVNDLLDATRLETGKLQVELAPNALAPVLEHVAEASKIAAKEHDITFVCDTGKTIDSVIMDKQRITQVLNNLIVNAMKFTQAGGSVALRATDEADAVLLCVEDTGCGIEPHAASRIFDRLHQVGEPAHNNGLGIGLSICKELLNLHHSNIELRTETGVGSTFSFRLRKSNTLSRETETDHELR